LENPFFKLNLRQPEEQQPEEPQLEEPQPEEPQPEEQHLVEFQDQYPKVLCKKRSWQRNLGQIRLK
jgi:hypothetical protein